MRSSRCHEDFDSYLTRGNKIDWEGGEEGDKGKFLLCEPSTFGFYTHIRIFLRKKNKIKSKRIKD